METEQSQDPPCFVEIAADEAFKDGNLATFPASKVGGGALVHCQEAILPGDATPVLLSVLRDPSRAAARDPSRAAARAAVSNIFHETAWHGNPPKLQVFAETTWHALQQLAATGLITFNTRATRHLSGDAPPPKPTLTPKKLQRIADLRAFAAKQQKVARLLIESDLPEEAELHQKAAEKALSEAAAIEGSSA